MTQLDPLPQDALPDSIRARFIDGVNDLRMHILEAGYETPDRPMLLLLHGFPELAYSWRKVMLPLARAGYHVVAPDQRGYGRTTDWDADFSADIGPFRMMALATDALALVRALGRSEVAAVIGHDFGSPVAAWCALTRPDVFRSVALMSAPFSGPPALVRRPAPVRDIHADLLDLPRPRKHYVWYYSTPEANADMMESPQGVHAFLRAYYHMKSADWAGNRPFALKAWSAAELARLPTYYVMDADADMAATVAADMPGAAEIAACQWLTEAELAVYTREFCRTSFQGGLNWYRGRIDGGNAGELLFAGRTIDVPSLFIAGRSDWGMHQRPGDLEAMRTRGCSRLAGIALVDGAGHWVQQEQPDAVVQLLLDFLRR